jgi:hypothetical protein
MGRAAMAPAIGMTCAAAPAAGFRGQDIAQRKPG